MVLAAGCASRFGATKQLAELDGRPLLLHVLDAAVAGGVDRSVVVTGHDADAVIAALGDRRDVEVARNPEYATGQASSVRAGIAAVAADRDARVAVILLADQPGIEPRTIRQVVTALEDGADVARASYDDGPAHPVAFPRRTWPELLSQLEGDVGARELMADLRVAQVMVAGPMPPDVDSLEDLQRLRAEADLGTSD